MNATASIHTKTMASAKRAPMIWSSDKNAKRSVEKSAVTDEYTEESLYEIAKKAREQKIWDENFAALILYKKRHGTIFFDKSTKQKHPSLYKWARRQRKRQDSLTEERREKLKSIGFGFEVSKRRSRDSWKLMYERLSAHMNQSKEVPPKIVKGDKVLFEWIKEQRTAYKSGVLLEEHKKALDRIGFVWNPAGDAEASPGKAFRSAIQKQAKQTSKQTHRPNDNFPPLEIQAKRATSEKPPSLMHDYSKSFEYFLREIYVPKHDCGLFLGFDQGYGKTDRDITSNQIPAIDESLLTTDGKEFTI